MHVFVHAHAQQTMGNGHDFIPLKNMLLAFALRYNVCSKHQMPKIQTSSLFHWSAEICAFGVHAQTLLWFQTYGYFFQFITFRLESTAIYCCKGLLAFLFETPIEPIFKC